MGKREYTDEQYADVLTRYTKRHRRIRLLVLGVGLAGVVAAGTASYVLMHRAETMSEDGIDEMTADDYIILDDEEALDAALNGANTAAEEADPDAPLIEDALGDEDGQAPDAFPADAFAAVEESETEAETSAAEEAPETRDEVVETAAEAEQAAAVETEQRESAAIVPGEPLETEASELAETEEPESADTEAVVAGETEALEAVETEAETEAVLTGTAQAGVEEKTAEDVYVETEGEDADPDWVQAVNLEVLDAEGLWEDTETEDDTVVEVEADQQLRFTLTCTVEPGKLNAESRTLIYRVPEEITSLTQSWGTIVDANEQPLADYTVEENGTIRITFTEETAQLNELGARITCKVLFRTTADAIK